ncbi:MAG: GatB/YqeY domain-containing protein [Amaricoccus sp.]|uniref:GatB/YqeY domain-containing protein n=1 Tax=Amaricoccus sp. TaxID=1872485 RepID=UPI0033157F67
MLREKFAADLKTAIKAKDAPRVSTLRLIIAAIKDRDIATRVGETVAEDRAEGVSDAEILAILARMIKQRQESAKIYEEAGRFDLAEQERSETEIIQAYLPRRLSEKEVQKAIAEAIAETGASSIRDMGRVMAHLKARHTGQMDFASAGAAIKDAFR